MSGFDVLQRLHELMARRPRLAGLLLIALCAALLGWNAYSMQRPEPFTGYYPSAYLLGYPGAMLGAWMLVTGTPIDRDGPRPPMWWVLGTLILVAGGLGYALFTLHVVHRWPSW